MLIFPFCVLYATSFRLKSKRALFYTFLPSVFCGLPRFLRRTVRLPGLHNSADGDNAYTDHPNPLNHLFLQALVVGVGPVFDVCSHIRASSTLLVRSCLFWPAPRVE